MHERARLQPRQKTWVTILLVAVLAAFVASSVTAPSAEARPCIWKGRSIKHRENITCVAAKRTLGRLFNAVNEQGTLDATLPGWDCWIGRYGTPGGTFVGYCESRRRYFDWRRAF